MPRLSQKLRLHARAPTGAVSAYVTTVLKVCMEECQLLAVMVWAFDRFRSIKVIGVSEGNVFGTFSFFHAAFKVAVCSGAISKMFVA